MLSTPLLLDFSEKIFPVLEQPPAPSSEAALSTQRLPILSPVHYFIRIYYPNNFKFLLPSAFCLLPPEFVE